MIFVTQMMQGFTLNNFVLKNFHLFFSSCFSHFLTCDKHGHIHIYKTTSDEVYDTDCSCPCYRLVAQVSRGVSRCLRQGGGVALFDPLVSPSFKRG